VKLYAGMILLVLVSIAGISAFSIREATDSACSIGVRSRTIALIRDVVHYS
jgi:hypothetical protein